MNTEKNIWKIRFVKNYPEAHNHLFVGDVLETTPVYVRVKGKTFHWGNAVCQLSDIRIGDNEVRIIPWARIEIINELVQEFNYADAELVMGADGAVVLEDDRHTCTISASLDTVY